MTFFLLFKIPLLTTYCYCFIGSVPNCNFFHREWNESLLSDVLSCLEKDLPLPHGVPGGSESYRLSLALSFFFRFFVDVNHKLSEVVSVLPFALLIKKSLNTSSSSTGYTADCCWSPRGLALDFPGSISGPFPVISGCAACCCCCCCFKLLYFTKVQTFQVPHFEAFKDDGSAVGLIQGGFSEAGQLFETVPEDQSKHDPIGRPLPHTSAFKQASGEAAYLDDMPRFESELYMGLVFSQRAHAKLTAVDPSLALAMHGVEAYIDHRDAVGSKDYQLSASRECVFPEEKVGRNFLKTFQKAFEFFYSILTQMCLINNIHTCRCHCKEYTHMYRRKFSSHGNT